MPSETKKDAYGEISNQTSRIPNVVRIGLISAASAVVGGLAAAWWYRRTLDKLQNPIAPSIIQKSGYLDEDSDSL